MQLSDKNKTIFDIAKRAAEFYAIDINGNDTNKFKAVYSQRIFAFISALVISSLYPYNLPSDFLTYGSSVLSILVGLFITAIIFSYNNFYNSEEIQKLKKDGVELDSHSRLLDIQDYNFTKRFAITTSYTTLICVFTLVYIGIYVIVSSFSKPPLESLIFLYHTPYSIAATTLANTALIYMMAIIFLRTFNIVTQMVVFIDAKLSRNKD